MPENLYLAATRGAGERYRRMAPRYLLNETWFDPLSKNKNILAGHHAYSFCNSLSSAMQAYLSDGSQKHLRAASNAFDMIAAQSYATGGWGPDESFRAPGSGAMYASLTNTRHSFETPCGSYAHFKLTRYLLRVTRDGKYGDSMERVFYNNVLGAKTLEKDGRAFYYSDYSNVGGKFYFDDKWPCCAGSLPQVAADYRKLGYFRDKTGVYVNLYLPSTLRWVAQDGAQLSLTQSGNYPIDGQINLMVRSSRPSDFALRLRIPGWAQTSGAAIAVNGQPIHAPITNGFANLHRRWRDGDRIELTLPMPMRLEPIDPEHPVTLISSTEIILDTINDYVNAHDYSIITKLKDGDLEIVKLTVVPGSPADGKRVVDIGLPRASIVVAVDRKGDDLLIPNGDTQIKSGDQVIVMVKKEQRNDVRAALIGIPAPA